jgi:predicted HAD superfamily Cof-like phosphohydrolase
MAKWKETGLDYFEEEKHYTPSAMVREFSKVLDQKPDVALYQRLICEEYEEWCKESPNTVKDLKELADLVYVIYGYALAAGYNLDEAVERVHDNNLGRCIQPDGTVKRREDGKIMKNPNYPAVYLEDLI